MCQLCEMLGHDVHLGDTFSFADQPAEVSMQASGADQAVITSSALENSFDAATVAGVTPSGNVYIDAVVAGYGRWSGQVSYSFPSNVSAYNGSYAVAVDGVQQVSATQIAAIQKILEGTNFCSVEAFCGLDIVQVADNTVRSSVNLQISQCDNFGGANLATARVGDFPGSPMFPGFPDAAGDVWFGDDSGNGTDDGLQGYRTPTMGNYAWLTHIHELGHALGLQHTFDSGAGPFGVVLPANRNSIEFSVMSYISYTGGPSTGGYTCEQFGFAQTYMMYDILALQYLYGADFTTNSGSSVYTWSPTTGQMFINGVGQGAPGANRIFLTIWDGGGNDTYDMSNYGNDVSIDLRPEMWSVTSAAQLADLDRFSSDPARIAHGNVYNAAQFDGDPRSLIENAIGGSGNDTLVGNDADNVLRGNSGNDSIDGGAGTDSAVFSGQRSAYTLTSLGGNSVRVAGPDGTDTLFNVERLVFDNIVLNWPQAAQQVRRNDFNGDSHSDVLWQNNDGTVTIWDNGQSAGTHTVANAGVVANSWHIVGTGDFDGNGHSDIVWWNNDTSVWVWDDGQLAGAHIVSGAGVVASSWHIVGTGDFDGNGRADILWHNDNGMNSIWDNGQIGGAHIISGAGVVASSWHIVGTGDFDGNGQSDILWHNDNGAASIWDNGQIGGAHIISDAGVVASSWHIVSTGDFDGNGRTDILWQNDNAAVSIWDNGQIGGAHIISNAGWVASSWHIAGAGDFDGNGRDDILWRNDNGTASIWDNAQIGSAHIIATAGVMPTDWHIIS